MTPFRPAVFLSYNKHDESLIRQIASDLRSHQIDAWYDQWEIKPGEPLRQRIFGEALPAVDAFFVYLTSESIKSKWVRDELDAAFVEEASEHGLRIITFVDHTDTIKLLRPDIAARNCPVINREAYEPGLRQLIRTICEATFERRIKQFEADVGYVLRRSQREIRLLDAIKRVGLVDIENRDDKEYGIPPIQFYMMAKKELFISGISAERTFDEASDTLRDTLDTGRLLRILIVRPDADCVPWLEKREKKSVKTDIEGVIRTVQRAGLLDHPNFRMRLIERFPTFTAVMIDGDVESSTGEVLNEAQVRMQPTTLAKSHHSGLVIQLKKSPEVPFPLFDFVAEELREQWVAAKELRELLASDLNSLAIS